ncbi:LysR family transcriptional regulator [Bradyrhizobium diazoefficiens]|jgi:DNA-binding transcriptional LysR family regulator|uniref:LysR family transcriptional regulator n=1 Tax=Bradyrhizobium TaxID=374 RepID=UPI001B8A2D2D|nr:MULTISPECIES: LysR family transcriptional regulator [Bradyrhizobium]MBR0704673.1 LysR family transcriptional regulator [Bradyrhizobium diazoefficiens]MBR0773003.1 LysR family transcriptional regulator [Bradyrhizobium diazoefficiens]MBR0926659.1 LysR family transcriptional regulator [Bradyrhizobium diazoefficiens]MCS3761578.1 DNA-binding transcriptional LysR family regulator [Bradyrhizobium centrosematis]MCS3774246.1 DNA-binding transcriptional LysR family regulator [Bradyrhizobium centrosem
METLANLESFVRSAECGSFSEAGRRLLLTPAAVSRNVAMLERNLGVRLFHRSTRRLTLTEAGETFRTAIAGHLEGLQAAIAGVSTGREEPAGILKISLPPTFGAAHILPLLPAFLARYPQVRPEWHFENRQVDLVGEGYDAAIGGGFELLPGLVSRTLAPAHIVAVASPVYMSGRTLPTQPDQLAALDGIVMRSLQTGRIRHWSMRDVSGREVQAPLSESIVVNDPAAMREAARLGLGVAMLATADILPALDDGSLLRLVPRWYCDAGAISIYHASRKLVPAKTRVFVDWVAEAFKKNRLAERFAGSLS